MIQTIPGLVMLGFALLLLGIGKTPALTVLALYAILPILRNTYTGIVQVDKNCIDAARGIGMSPHQILFQVELPLALPSIVSGVRDFHGLHHELGDPGRAHRRGRTGRPDLDRASPLIIPSTSSPVPSPRAFWPLWPAR